MTQKVFVFDDDIQNHFKNKLCTDPFCLSSEELTFLNENILRQPNNKKNLVTTEQCAARLESFTIRYYDRKKIFLAIGITKTVALRKKFFDALYDLFCLASCHPGVLEEGPQNNSFDVKSCFLENAEDCHKHRHTGSVQEIFCEDSGFIDLAKKDQSDLLHVCDLVHMVRDRALEIFAADQKKENEEKHGRNEKNGKNEESGEKEEKEKKKEKGKEKNTSNDCVEGFKAFHIEDRGVVPSTNRASNLVFEEKGVYCEDGIVLGERGLHFCLHPLQCLIYYRGGYEKVVFARVRALGRIIRGYDKMVTSKLQIVEFIDRKRFLREFCTGKLFVGNGDIFWFEKGLLHRNNSLPAIERSNGIMEFFEDGKRTSSCQSFFSNQKINGCLFP